MKLPRIPPRNKFFNIHVYGYGHMGKKNKTQERIQFGDHNVYAVFSKFLHILVKILYSAFTHEILFKNIIFDICIILLHNISII